MVVRGDNVPVETVAVGDLFKLGGSQGGRRTWNLRRFYLAGIYLSYYNRAGKKKGQWDIRDCAVRKTTPEECKMPDAVYAFCLTGKNKFYVMCASNEKSRTVWIRCISEQIDEFKLDIRQHLLRGEIVIADEKLRKKGGMLGLYLPIRLVITNYPKIMVLEANECIRREQLSWGRDDPPKFTTLSDKRFKIYFGKNKDLMLEDEERGSIFWETLFRRFPDVELFVAEPRVVENVDFPEIYDDKAPMITETAEAEAEAADHIASMEIGDLELSASNLNMLESALGNVRELVTAISSKIIAIEEEIDWELESRDPVFAAAAAEDRAQRKIQLQMLKDNVAVISANLEALVARSIEVGITNIDMYPVENVISETSAMLVMLNFEDERPPIVPAHTQGTNNYLAPDPNQNNLQSSSSLKSSSKSAATYSLEPAVIGEPVDLEITYDNFDANDIHKRPAHWNEVRIKRVLVMEVYDMLQGLSFEEIADSRKLKVAQVEAEMVQEVMNYGRLLNTDVIRGVRATDCNYLHETITDFVQQHVHPSVLEKVIKASLVVTADNYVESDWEVRPPGWQYVKTSRVRNKNDSSLSESQQFVAFNSEEEMMITEVREFGQVQVDDVVFGLTTALADAIQQNVAPQPSNEFDPNDPTKRPAGWTELRNERVNQKERIDRLQGHNSSEVTPRSEREQQEERQLLAEVAHEGNVQDYLTRASFVTRGRNKSMGLSYFISAANMTLEELSEQVVESLNEEASSRSNHLRISHGPATSSKENPTTKHSVLSFVPRSSEALKVNLREVKVGLKHVPMKDDLKQLHITAGNFDVNNPKKRPVGWEQVRLRRVIKREEDDRAMGMGEDKILALRGVRVAQEEQNMIQEVSVSGRIRLLNMKKSAPVFPKNYHSAYAAAKPTPQPPMTKPPPPRISNPANSTSTRGLFNVSTSSTGSSSPDGRAYTSENKRESVKIAFKGNPLSHAKSRSSPSLRKDSSGTAPGASPENTSSKSDDDVW